MLHRLIFAALVVVAVPAHANVGRRILPGQRGGEPAGLREIAIEQEELSFDLRPLAHEGLAQVAATYHLDNRGAANVNAPLVFASGVAQLEGFRVTFDGAPLRGDPTTLTDAEAAALPAAWRPPATTPALDGDGALPFETEDARSIAFTLDIPPGRHELAVFYRASPQLNRSTDGGTIVWQVAYVLAPARDWGSFGTLDLSIQVPAGWRAAVSPALARSGDTLRARFSALPADTIGITVQAPTGMLHAVAQILLPLLLLVALVGGPLVLWRAGRARGRTIKGVWTVALVGGLVWGVAIAVAGGLAAMRDSFGLPEHQCASYGYGAGLGVLTAVLGALVAVPIGYAITRAGYKGVAASDDGASQG